MMTLPQYHLIMSKWYFLSIQLYIFLDLVIEHLMFFTSVYPRDIIQGISNENFQILSRIMSREIFLIWELVRQKHR